MLFRTPCYSSNRKYGGVLRAGKIMSSFGYDIWCCAMDMTYAAQSILRGDIWGYAADWHLYSNSV